MYWYHSKGYTVGTPYAIFAKAKAAGVWTDWTNSYYWASAEYYSSNAWGMGFSGGILYNLSEYYTHYVRAVAAF